MHANRNNSTDGLNLLPAKVKDTLFETHVAEKKIKQQMSWGNSGERENKKLFFDIALTSIQLIYTEAMLS